MKFRVLHLSSESGWRGGEQQVAYLVDELSLKGVECVLVVRKASRLEQFCIDKKIPFHTVKFTNSFDFASALGISAICRKEKIDVIHVHTSKAQGVAVLAAVLGNRVPMVLSRRVAFMPGRNQFSKWKYNHKQIKRIICISQKITLIMQSYVRDVAKCVTVYSGIDLDKLKNIEKDKLVLKHEFALNKDRIIVGTIGAIDKSKDHFTFIDTIEKCLLFNDKIHAVIIGEGPLRPSLEKYIIDKGLENRITLTGYRKDVLKLLLSLDIFLMTSEEEGLGTSLLDAFLAGVPVVATAAGGIPEIVRHMETGMLAPIKDSQTLSEHIRFLLNNQKIREQLVNQARDFVRLFSKQEMAAKTLDIYREVLTKTV